MNRFFFLFSILILVFPIILFSKDDLRVSVSNVHTKSQSVDSIKSSNRFSKIIAIYDNDSIPSGLGISKGSYTNIDGYQYVNIAVEYEQINANEAPLSLGVVFAYSNNGKLGSRRYFSFDQNNTIPADPQIITVSGKNCWHGSPHNKSSYIVRLPIMGPYLQVFPFNNHTAPRKFSVILYLTK